MSVQHIINESLIQYDKTYNVIKYLLTNTDRETIETNNDSERTRFKFIDKNTKEVVLESEVETLAVFYDKLRIWSWAWSLTGLTTSQNYLSKEILMYALTLDPDLTYIKSILTTSRGIIKDITQIDINLAISTGIIKQPYVYPLVFSIRENNLIYYYVLLNKDALDKLKEKIESYKL